MKKLTLLFLLFTVFCLTGKIQAQLPKGMVDLTSELVAGDANFALTTEDDRAGTFKSTLEVIGDKMFFTATSTATGDELYVTDGTVEGTVLLKDINTSGDASPRYLIVLNDKLYFQADDGINGIELWESNGTESGTIMIADINLAGSSAPDMLTVLGDKILFRASTLASSASGEKWLHIYDPATETVSLVAEIQARESGDAQMRRIQADNTHLVAYFIGQPTGENEEMYITDGTTIGTRKLMDICPEDITSSGIQWPFVFADSICIWRQNAPRKWAGADSVNYTKSLGAQLWFYNFNTDEVKFLSHFNKTVGTSGDGDDTQYAWPVEFNGKIYFRAHDGVHGVEMSTTDWTSDGTRQIKDLNPGADASWVEDWAVFKGLLLFNGNAGNGQEGGELRYLDEENEDIKLYSYANPGDNGSWPQRTTVWQVNGVDSMVYFNGEGATTGGRELFVAKGLGEQAEFIGSVGASGSTPHNLTSWKNAMVFTTNKVKRLFSYVYTVQPKILASGSLTFLSTNMLDTSEITIERYQGELFDNKTVKIQIKAGESGFKISNSPEGPFGTDPIYTANEDVSTFYLLPDYSIISLDELKTSCVIQLLSLNIDTLELNAQTILAPLFHNELIYSVDIGNDSNVIINSMEVLGSSQSVFDQLYGPDPVTNKNWGRVRASWGIEASDNEWGTMREQNFAADSTGLLYEFEVEPGDYVIQYGWYEHWGARTNRIIVNDAIKVASVVSLPKDYLTGTFEATITGNKLSFNVISIDKNNPYLSWFKIGKKCTEGCETACFGDPVCDYRMSQYGSVGVNEVDNNQNLKVYPNPANGYINIVMDKPENSSLNIYNMAGILVYSQIINSQFNLIDINQLQKGMYLLKVENSNGMNINKLVIK